MLRNQNLVGLKLPELSEAAEQEKGAVPQKECVFVTHLFFFLKRN